MGHIRQLSKQQGVQTVPMPRDMPESKGVLQRIKIKMHVLLSVRFRIFYISLILLFFNGENKPQKNKKIKTSESFLILLNLMKREGFGISAICNIPATMVSTLYLIYSGICQ